MGSQFRVAAAASGDASAPSARAPDDKSVGHTCSAEDTVDALYRAERPGLLRRLGRRANGRDDALDIVHDAFVRLLGLGSGRILALEQERPGAYLNRTATNLTRDRQKASVRHASHLHVVADDNILAGPDPVLHIEARDELRRFEAALLQLRPKPRAIYVAHRIDGLSYGEIAAQYGISVKGVEKHMAYAIATISQLVNRD